MLSTQMKSEWTKILLAVSLVALAALIRSVFIPGLRETPYVVFYPAVIITALYGGLRPGLLAVFLSVIGSATWFGPGLNLDFYIPGRPVGLVTFLIGGAVIVFISAQLIEAKRKITAEARRLRENERSLQSEVARRSHAEEALKQSESYLDAIIENAPACIKLVAADGTLIKMNNAGLRIIGSDSLERIQGKSIYNFVAPQDRTAFIKLTRDVFENKAGSLEFEADTLDGRHLWLNTHAVPLYDSAGTITALLGITVDITERKTIELALRESKARLEAIASTAFDAMILIDNDGNVSFWNDSATRMFGYTREEMVGKHMHSYLMPGRHNDAFQTGFAEFRKTGTGPLVGTVYEVEAKRKDGTQFPVELSVAALKLQGKWCAIGIVRDITDRKRAEKELLRISWKNKLILESAGEGIWGVDTNGNVTFINRTAAATLGYEVDELIGKPSHSTWHYRRPDGADYPPEECPIYAAYKDGADHTGEETFWRKDGSGFPVDFTSRPIFEGNRIAGAVITFRDITKRKQGEEAVRQSEERLKRSQEIAHLGSWELDLVKNSLAWTDEVYRIFGLQPQEFGATYEVFLDAVHPEDREAVDKAYSGSLQEGRDTYEIEHRVVRRSTGEIRYVHEKCQHFRDRAGRIIRSAGMVHDITDRKKGEEEREQLIAELQRSNSELEQFAYVASHDLQEPLRMVSSYVALLQRKYQERLDEKAEQYIRFAVDGADRMQNLIEGLLDYSRITRRGAEFKPVDLNSVFSAAVSNLAVTIRDSGAQITKDELPIVPGDKTQLVQLFQNLIGNGIKYRKPDVPAQVHVAGKKDGLNYVLSVRDNGIGIESKYFEKIFQIFQRLHTRSQYSGTGIGLALCKRIVERHQGRIWLESVPGQGSTFFFTIPIRLHPSPASGSPLKAENKGALSFGERVR